MDGPLRSRGVHGGRLEAESAPVLRALEQMRVERAWMIGDTPDDVRAARAAGVVPWASITGGEFLEVLLRAGVRTRLTQPLTAAGVASMTERVASVSRTTQRAIRCT